MEPVFRTLELAGRAAVWSTGTRITYRGLEHIPASGAAVVAINHTGYLDFLPAALAAMHRGRRMRFMIKAEMDDVPIVHFLITHTKTIPVDRRAGADAYGAAVQRLREGELVGVYPEATISRSFELKDFKSGAVRMARDARAPIVPLIVWGAQRVWTKDHPKNLRRSKIPITVAVGPAIDPSESPSESDVAAMARLRETMTTLLHGVQDDYAHPAGEYWVPHRLGGGAPTMEEARVLEQAEFSERARRRAEPN